jgi:glycosyltransferase involved in cell wall biosynthesis
MEKICFVATIPAVVHTFLRGHIQAAANEYEVTVICNAADKFLLDDLAGRLILLPIERKPSPWGDTLVLLKLFRLFRRERFDIVHTHMPKTGLLGILAAWLASVPIRINTFHGEVWATRSGWRRAALKLLDRLIVSLATNTLVVSPSQQLFLECEGVLPPGKAKLIGAGSVCGVDTTRFHSNKDIGNKVRNDLGIARDANVILFVGRLNRDKGMLDLAAAFNTIAKYHPDVVLLLVGAEEDVPFNTIRKICQTAPERLYYVNFSSTPERYMMLADIYCLPSYREGFGLTIIEAAACAVPTIASRIYGIKDAVADGETGLLFPAGDVEALTNNLIKLIVEKDLRKHMGNMACLRAKRLFSSETIISETMMFYERLIQERRCKHDKAKAYNKST